MQDFYGKTQNAFVITIFFNVEYISTENEKHEIMFVQEILNLERLCKTNP